MTKQEFLEELKERLIAEGADALVPDNLSFYSSYIDGETAKGRSEDEVIEELGGANVIAHSILDAAGFKVDGIPDEIEKDGAETSEASSGACGDSGGSGYDSRDNTPNPSDTFGTVLRTIIGVVIAVMILYLCLVVLGFLWPVILIIVLIALFYRLFQGR